MNAVDFARELIDIDSTTGREQEAGEWLARSLRSLGYRVDEQPVSDGRRNVVATIDSPVVVPGSRQVTTGRGPEWGLSLATPVIVKYRDEQTDARTALEEGLR